MHSGSMSSIYPGVVWSAEGMILIYLLWIKDAVYRFNAKLNETDLVSPVTVLSI